MQINGNYGSIYNDWGQNSKVQQAKQTGMGNMLGENRHYAGNINLRWSDGAIYAEGTPEGNSFSIYKEADYSKENPWMCVRGIDKEGNSYEERINAKEVNPQSASYIELKALNAYLVDNGELETGSMGFFPRKNEDDLVKQNYMKILQEWRDMQYNMGNLAGYKNFSAVCNVLAHYIKW